MIFFSLLVGGGICTQSRQWIFKHAIQEDLLVQTYRCKSQANFIIKCIFCQMLKNSSFILNQQSPRPPSRFNGTTGRHCHSSQSSQSGCSATRPTESNPFPFNLLCTASSYASDQSSTYEFNCCPTTGTLYCCPKWFYPSPPATCPCRTPAKP